MPAYIHQHDDIEPAFVICPSCVGLPMYVRDVSRIGAWRRSTSLMNAPIVARKFAGP